MSSEEFSLKDLAYINQRVAELKAVEKRRYDAVMAEIDKDEAEARQKLREVLVRRVIVARVGHHG